LNKVMKLLTAITTICLPLTIVSSWYGMNFINMPEIKWEYGYFVVIPVTVIVIIVLFVIFKKNKYF